MNQYYPSDQELEQIREWIVSGLSAYHALMTFVRERWAYADCGYFDQETIGDQGIYRLHTAGWSGNESLIGAMQDNFVFWAMYWLQSRRGGHYIFAPMRTDTDLIKE